MHRQTGDTDEQRFQLQRAAAGVARRGETPNMWAVYVLELRPDPETGDPKFYVGHTNALLKRIHDHAVGNSNSCAWVRRWGFCKVLETIRTDGHSALVLESSKTAEYKVRFGWDHCRGCQDNNPGSSLSAQPSFWTAPPEGTERDRERTPPRSVGGA
jgi:predicted GIY-YIG superfamily endonuclease